MIRKFYDIDLCGKGGGIFPMPNAQVNANQLTKRELIAAMAMQGYLPCYTDPQVVAIEACKYADALLEALSKPSK